MKIADELRIIKDHWYFRLIKRTRPLTIHTECMHKENVWEATKKFVNEGGFGIWYVVTPVNYEFVKAQSGCRLSEQDFEKTILERYKWLQDHGQKIQAHVHLRVKMHMYSPEEREDIGRKITDATKWLRKNGFEVDEIVFGWWSDDQEAVEIAGKNGLKKIGRLDYYFIHDYDLVKG
jgi:hypothetical protein